MIHWLADYGVLTLSLIALAVNAVNTWQIRQMKRRGEL